MDAICFKPLSCEEKAWFQQLEKKIWIHHKGEPYSKNPGYSKSLRNLYLREWTMLKKKIQDYNLPCRLCACMYGFGFQVFDHVRKDNWQATMLISLDEGQIPAAERNVMYIAEQFTHNERNRVLLRHYGMPPLENPGHYTY